MEISRGMSKQPSASTLNPKGIPSFSPGLPSLRGYPGSRWKIGSTLMGLSQLRSPMGTTLSGLMVILCRYPG